MPFDKIKGGYEKVFKLIIIFLKRDLNNYYITMGDFYE